MSALSDLILRRIEERRSESKDHKFSQRAAAGEMKIPVSTLNDLIRGEGKSHDTPTFERVAQWLGLALSDVIDLASTLSKPPSGSAEQRAQRLLRNLTPTEQEFLFDEMDLDELRSFIDFARQQRRRRSPPGG